MLGWVAASTVALAGVLPRAAEVDFDALPPKEAAKSYQLTVAVEAASGVRHVFTFIISGTETHEGARDFVAFRLKQRGWEVRSVKQTELIVTGHDGSPVRKLEFDTTAGLTPAVRWVLAPRPWPVVSPRDPETARRDRLNNVRRSLADLEEDIEHYDRAVEKGVPDPAQLAYLARSTVRFRDEVKQLRAEERRLWAQQPGGITAPPPREKK